MSAVPPKTPRSAKRKPALPALCTAYAEALAAELARVLNAPLPLETQPLEIVAAERVCGRDELVAETRFRVLDEDGALLRFVVPAADATTLACLRRGAGKEEIAAERERSLGGEQLEAFGELVERAADVLARLLSERVGCAGLERTGDDAEEPGAGARDANAGEEPEAPAADATAGPETAATTAATPPPAGAAEPESFVRARFLCALEGFPKGRIDLLWPEELAARWFGYGPRVPLAERPLRLLDACEADRGAAPALAAALGRAVEASEVDALGIDLCGELAEAGAIVIAWDLGGRAGLELAEALAQDPRTRHIPVLLAAAAPTRAMVDAALRAGARGFLCKPYDPEEIRRRLG